MGFRRFGQPIPRFGEALGQGSITPSLILPSTAQLAWWSASSGIYTDTGLTTPANNGATVKGWADKGPSGYHVTQSAAGANQVYVAALAAFNNRPAVQFLNSGFLSKTGMAAGIVANLSVYTMYAVFRTTSPTVEYFYSEGRLSTSVPFAGINHDGSGNVAGFQRSDASVSANPSGGAPNATDGKAHIVTLRRIASNSWAIRLDGVQVATAANAPGATTIDQIALGCFIRNTNTAFFTGHLGQVALYSADNFAVIEPTLANFYGIALP